MWIHAVRRSESLLIEKLNELIRVDGKYVCLTRPHPPGAQGEKIWYTARVRNSETINANMLGAYYTKGYDSHPIFDNLSIAKTENYEKHINSHHVIYIDFSRMPDPCENYMQYIEYVKIKLFSDLQKAYNIERQLGLTINDYFNQTNDSFIFILDEWDSIFYKDFMTSKDKTAYLEFLKGLLKDQPYVELAYMTGVLPIAKYSSGSELNMFEEYSFTRCGPMA